LPGPDALAGAAARQQASYDRFVGALHAVGPQPLTALSWYTIWSCFVRAEGSFHRDACLMSKVFMTAVWSWDHCFNALALADHHPALAFDQFLLPFHLQAANGALPDLFAPNAATIWGVTKVPIHGWAFVQLMERIPFTTAQLATVYDHLARWTEWYNVYRDRDQDGIVEVAMGCDDQDNGSAFLGAFFVESPDVTAYLATQEFALARIATALGRTADAARWNSAGETRIAALVRHCWDGTQFFHTSDPDHRRVPEGHGSTTIMPLILSLIHI
jgi:putative isomerase